MKHTVLCSEFYTREYKRVHTLVSFVSSRFELLFNVIFSSSQNSVSYPGPAEPEYDHSFANSVDQDSWVIKKPTDLAKMYVNLY